jgi:ABC-2 type transport system ATP-binding protein
VAKILAELAVEDLEVRDPPIEDLIGQVFRQGEVG